MEKRNKKWSQKVTENSHALQLEEGVFTWDDPLRIAKSLKKSAEQSHQRKGAPYQSASAMLTFYINRAGKKLLPEQKSILVAAKLELKKIFHHT
ncbi:MAG: DUF3175 domain-containing protein [Gammaproteobacteria bacterium]|nr:DUF3175 domain-containing protein [Gammaproteobacteria bacterium]